MIRCRMPPENSCGNAFARWAYQGNWNPCEGCGGDTWGASDTYIPRAALVGNTVYLAWTDPAAKTVKVQKILWSGGL